jgi:MYXO-CTERM domain-containing protein
MRLLSRFAVAPLVFLVPAVALAESEDSCAHATYEAPKLHPTNQPLPRDGWIAIESESGYYTHPFTDVRVRDGAGLEIATTAVFDETTHRNHEIFAPVEVLEPGDHELVFTYASDCFEPMEVVLPLQVADALAEPIDASPVIGEIEAKVFDGRELHLEIDIPTQSAPGWTLVEDDFSPESSWWVATLVAPGESDRVIFHRDVEGEDVSEACIRATFYDLAGVAGPTTEQCTKEIESISTAQGPGALGCRVGGASSPTWALGLLLALALWRRRNP